MPHTEPTTAQETIPPLTPLERTDRQLRFMMRSVGLGDIPLSALGGNHPVKAHKKAQREPSGKTQVKKTSAQKSKTAAAKSSKSQTQSRARRDMARFSPDSRTAEPVTAKAPVTPDYSTVGAYVREDDMDPISLAHWIQAHMDRIGGNVTQTADELGRSRSYVRNHLRLLTLPESLQALVRNGELREGHGRAIAKMRDPEAMARLIIRRKLSVRAVETIARRLRYLGPNGELLRETAMPNSYLAQNLIEDAIGFKTEVKDRAGRGKMILHYNSPEEFQTLVGRLTDALRKVGL